MTAPTFSGKLNDKLIECCMHGCMISHFHMFDLQHYCWISSLAAISMPGVWDIHTGRCRLIIQCVALALSW